MGKATIVSGGADGLYNILRNYDETNYQRQVSALNSQVSGLTDAIAALEGTLPDLETKVADAAAAVDAAIVAYTAAAAGGVVPKAELDAFNAAVIASGEAVASLRSTRWQISLLKSDRTSAIKRKETLDAAKASTIPEPAWCADLTENASGAVATIEIPGEVGTIVIRPQSPVAEDQAYAAARDGLLMPREWMSPEQAYFNAAILPGWQRHQPTYRAGTITAIDVDANVCDVALDAATSSAQDLEINAVAALESVPVSYMTCNAAAFDVGDRVVIEFAGQDWAAPTVIGFLHNPVACIAGRMVWMPEGFWLTPRNNEAPNGWGLPIVDGVPTAGGPITQVIINRQAKNNYPDELFGSRVAPQTLYYTDEEDDEAGPRGSRIGIIESGEPLQPQFGARWQQVYREADSAAWHCHRAETIPAYGSAVLEAIFASTNELRASLELPPLLRPLRGIYNADAYSVVREMVLTQTQAHTYSGYTDGYENFTERLQRSGWVTFTVGENLATAVQGPLTATQFGEAIVDGWEASPYHYANMITAWANPAAPEQAAFMLLAASPNTVTQYEAEPGAPLVEPDPPVTGLSVAQVFHGTSVWVFAYPAVFQGAHGTVSWNAPHNNRYFTYRVQSLWGTNADMEAYRRFTMKGRLSENIPWGDTLDVRAIVGAGVVNVGGVVSVRLVTFQRIIALDGIVTGVLELWNVPGDGRMSGATKLAETSSIFNVVALQRALFSFDGTKAVVGVHRAKTVTGVGCVRQDQVNFNTLTDLGVYYGSEILWYEFDGSAWALRSTEGVDVEVVTVSSEDLGGGNWLNTVEQQCVGSYKWLADYDEDSNLVYATVSVDMHAMQTAVHDYEHEYLSDWENVDVDVSSYSNQVDVEITIEWPDLTEFVATQTTSSQFSLSGHTTNIIDLDIRDPGKMTYARVDLSCPAESLDIVAALTLIRAGVTLKTKDNILPHPGAPALPDLWKKGCAWGGGIIDMHPTRELFIEDANVTVWYGHWPIGTSYDIIREPHAIYGYYGNTRVTQPAKIETDTIGGTRWGSAGSESRPMWNTHTRAAPSMVQVSGRSGLTVCEYGGEWILSGLFRNVWGPNSYGFGEADPENRFMWRSSLDLNAITGVTLGNSIGPVGVL